MFGTEVLIYQKNLSGGWLRFGKALVWSDPNCHEICLDWSKLHPNRRCSTILPFLNNHVMHRFVWIDHLKSPPLTVQPWLHCLCTTHGSRERKAKGAVGNANRLWCSFMYIEDLKLRCVIIISNQLGTLNTFFLSQSSVSSLIQFVCFSLLTNWPCLAKKRSRLRPRKHDGLVKW